MQLVVLCCVFVFCALAYGYPVRVAKCLWAACLPLLAFNGFLSDEIMSWHLDEPSVVFRAEGVKWKKMLWASTVCQPAIMDDIVVLNTVLG